MPGKPDKANSCLPAPVMAAALAIIITRLFNLLMFIRQPEGVPREGVFRELTTLPGYLWLFSVLLVILMADLISAGLLLARRRIGRAIFSGCQCLMLLIAVIFGWQGVGLVSGVDAADAGQLQGHLLLQKIPDMVILLMLYLPSSSRHHFQREQK